MPRQSHPSWAVFSPGVRLFQHLRFRAKAALISIAFLIPVALLGASYWHSKVDAINATQQELDGLHYVRAVLPSIKLARQQRRHTMMAVSSGSTPPELAEVRDKLAAQMALLGQATAEQGARMGTEALVASAQAANTASAPASAGLFKVFASHTKFNSLLRQILVKAADSSGLTLDPEIDSYYAQDAAVSVLPELLEATAKMRVLAAAVARSGKDGTLATLELAQEEGLIEYLVGALQNDLAKVGGSHPEHKAALDVTAALKAITLLRDLADDSPQGAGVAGANKIEAAGADIVNRLETVQRDILDVLQQLLTARQAGLQNSLYTVGALVLLFLLAAGYMFGAFILAVGDGLHTMRRHLSVMAGGDLTTAMEVQGTDETAQLTLSLQQMQQSLVQLVALMGNTSEQVASNSAQVASGAQDLSQRTQETVEALQNTAAAILQISGTISSSSQSAELATQLARENADLATRGGQVIGALVGTMEEIRASSSQIGDIISVIDGIAFQTNILALNAAVEAARAGESGRGFAVVASEVRALAQRSAGAANEIKLLITASVAKVKLGNETVQAAGATTEKIVASARRISGLLEDISVAAREQSLGVKEIESDVQNLDLASRDNARQVEETSASADAMSALANELVGAVSTFKLPQARRADRPGPARR